MRSSRSAPAATAASQRARATAHHLADEPGAPTSEVDHADLTEGGGEAALVVELLRELDGTAVRLLGAVEVDLDRRAAERLAQRAPQERLTELEGRPELRRPRRPARRRAR